MAHGNLERGNMTKKKTVKPIVARIRSGSDRMREWATLTGKSESAIAEFFCDAGLALLEHARPDTLLFTRDAIRDRLGAFAESAKLRKQARDLNRRASELSRGKGTR